MEYLIVQMADNGYVVHTSEGVPNDAKYLNDYALQGWTFVAVLEQGSVEQYTSILMQRPRSFRPAQPYEVKEGLDVRAY